MTTANRLVFSPQGQENGGPITGASRTVRYVAHSFSASPSANPVGTRKRNEDPNVRDGSPCMVGRCPTSSLDHRAAPVGAAAVERRPGLRPADARRRRSDPARVQLGPDRGGRRAVRGAPACAAFRPRRHRVRVRVGASRCSCARARCLHPRPGRRRRAAPGHPPHGHDHRPSGIAGRHAGPRRGPVAPPGASRRRADRSAPGPDRHVGGRARSAAVHRRPGDRFAPVGSTKSRSGVPEAAMWPPESGPGRRPRHCFSVCFPSQMGTSPLCETQARRRLTDRKQYVESVVGMDAIPPRRLFRHEGPTP
jgi:hypothetical protein